MSFGDIHLIMNSQNLKSLSFSVQDLMLIILIKKKRFDADNRKRWVGGGGVFIMSA